MGLTDAQDYANKLKKAEKVRELRDQVSNNKKMLLSFVRSRFVLQRITPPGRRSAVRGSAGSGHGGLLL